MKKITLTSPFDMHLHLRDNDMLELVAPLTSKTFAGAIVMPNLVPCVDTKEAVIAYKNRINDETSPENLEEWDSFNFYVLLDELENEFNIKFDLDETLEIKKISDFRKIFEKHGISDI